MHVGTAAGGSTRTRDSTTHLADLGVESRAATWSVRAGSVAKWNLVILAVRERSCSRTAARGRNRVYTCLVGAVVRRGAVARGITRSGVGVLGRESASMPNTAQPAPNAAKRSQTHHYTIIDGL